MTFASRASGRSRKTCSGSLRCRARPISADPRLTVTVLSHLTPLGIGVILGDFGIGSSSPGCLRQFPVDALKIDRSLIRERQTDRAASDMVEDVIRSRSHMNLRVIAEGVETVKQLEPLTELGCQFHQG